MRWLPNLVVLGFVSVAACSRGEHARRKAPAPSAPEVSSDTVLLGPRLDAPPEAGAGSSASGRVAPGEARAPDASDAGPTAPALPVVDAEGLLNEIRRSGKRGVVV